MWFVNFKMAVMEIGCEDGRLMKLAQDRAT